MQLCKDECCNRFANIVDNELPLEVRLGGISRFTKQCDDVGFGALSNRAFGVFQTFDYERHKIPELELMYIMRLRNVRAQALRVLSSSKHQPL